jgi:hypothetical protein
MFLMPSVEQLAMAFGRRGHLPIETD